MKKEVSCIWTPAHLEEINRVFPEVLTYKDTNELIENIGKRKVVQYIKDKVIRGANASTASKSIECRRDN